MVKSSGRESVSSKINRSSLEATKEIVGPSQSTASIVPASKWQQMAIAVAKETAMEPAISGRLRDDVRAQRFSA